MANVEIKECSFIMLRDSIWNFIDNHDKTQRMTSQHKLAV